MRPPRRVTSETPEMSSPPTTIGSAAVSGTLFNICSRRASCDAPNEPEVGVSGKRSGMTIAVSVYGPGGTFWIENDPSGRGVVVEHERALSELGPA